jgi:hypothetical protein
MPDAYQRSMPDEPKIKAQLIQDLPDCHRRWNMLQSALKAITRMSETLEISGQESEREE